MLNLVNVQGRITNDLVLKATATGKEVITFSIACERDFRSPETNMREADFFDIVAWDSTAVFISKYFHKGDTMIVNGRLQNRTYNDSEGKRRKVTEIVAKDVYFGGRKAEDKSAKKDAETDLDFAGIEEEYSDIFK